jgi:Pyruvate/2-oxoacid:ferredoxin oxidoreductase delta subunit
MTVSININPSKYIGCSLCAILCPTYTLSVPCDNFKCQVNRDLCNSCLVCLDYRTSDAIEEV